MEIEFNQDNPPKLVKVHQYHKRPYLGLVIKCSEQSVITMCRHI
jgi:hypothetical protein